MANEILLSASLRATSGTAAARRMRRAGIMPAVLCDEHGNATSIQLDTHGFEKMLTKHSGENLLITLVVDGAEARKVLLREVQHDPLRGSARHADFVQVSLTRKMRITVPIELTGEPVGVTQQGGVLEQLLREIEIECLPGDLIEELVVDVAALKLGESLHVRDLAIGSALTILDDGDVAVATVASMIAEEASDVAAAADGKPEPEVITARRDEKEKEGSGKA